MLGHVVSCFVASCHTMSSSVTLSKVISYHIMILLSQVMSRYVMLCHVMSGWPEWLHLGIKCSWCTLAGIDFF